MIRLEYFTPEDYDLLIEWIQDETLLMNWSGSLFKFPLNKEKLDWYLEDANDIKTSEVFIYKVIDTNSGETVGHISLGGISKNNSSARVSRVLVGDTAERGRGICTDMMSAVLKIGFEELKMHRISLGVYDFNKSAIRCYEKAGLVVEGVMRDVLKYKGEYWSLVEMSILEEEWRNMKDKPL